MKKSSLLLVLALVATATTASAWPKPEVTLGPGLDAGRVVYNQTWNRTLSPDTLYVLTGQYSVDSTYTLTIPAGTVVRCDTASVLVIRRGAKIYATGEPCAPVVLTSLKEPGQRNRGDWGGVIILGKAPCNKVEPLIEGGIIEGTYGGSDANDDSGVFKYVRIEYPGYRYQLNNETNGLTMGGVGAGTEIHHVQVSYSFDDGFEWFGGTVNATHLVNYGGTDDEFDTDFGYNGRVQFAFGMKDPNLWDPTGETNGYESDNDGSSSSTATPYTAPVFANTTLIGPLHADSDTLVAGNRFQYSAVLRRSTMCSVLNSAIGGFPWGFSIRDARTIDHADLPVGVAGVADTLEVRNVTLAAARIPSGSTSVHDEGRWAGVTAWFNTPAFGNTGSTVTALSALGLGDLTNMADPNPVPQAGSPLIGSANWTNTDFAASFDTVSYRGAFEPGVPMSQQWTACWTNFNPQRFTVTAVEDGSVPARGAALGQNYPNPFNPMTAIRFQVPVRGHVSLKVYNVRGEVVRTVVDEAMIAGAFENFW